MEDKAILNINENKYAKTNIITRFGKTYRIIHKNNIIAKNIFCAHLGIIYNDIQKYYNVCSQFIIEHYLIVLLYVIFGVVMLFTYAIVNVDKKIITLIEKCVYSNYCDEHYLKFDCSDIVDEVKENPDDIDILIKCYKQQNINWYIEGINYAFLIIGIIVLHILIYALIVFIITNLLKIFVKIIKKIFMKHKINIDIELPQVEEEVKAVKEGLEEA